MTYLLTSSNEAATGTGLHRGTFAAAASNFHGSSGAHSMPISIPSDQVYYWSYRWQESERKAREDLVNGRSQVFSDPTDAVRHLLR